MATHHGFLKEFPWIRVDAFDGDPVTINPFTHQAPHIYLLTHAHTDHITGLNSPKWEGKLYTSAVTKHLLRHTMEAADRVLAEELPHIAKKRKFANLTRVDGRRRDRNGRATTAMDRVQTLPINAPVEIEGPAGAKVVVTAIDANHCPGSCMFLIEGSRAGKHTAVLVTGDIRAEDWWVNSLRNNTLLSKYIQWSGYVSETSESTPRLDNIYLDTSCVMIDEELLSKEEAIRDFVEHVQMYPKDTRFFLNVWTWGYEELLKEVYRAFAEPVHLDWYKGQIYCADEISRIDPLLSHLGTRKSRQTRFHACERRWKCDETWGDGLGCYEFDEQYLPSLRGSKKLKVPKKNSRRTDSAEIVYVNPTEMPKWKWEQYKKDLRGKLAEEQAPSSRPDYLIVPLARHSTLPELRRFVSLFKPRTLFPLTIMENQRQPGRDYLAMPMLFADCLGPGGQKQLASEAQEWVRTQQRSRVHALQSVVHPISSIDEINDNLDYFVNARSDRIAQNIEGSDEALEAITNWAQFTSELTNPVPSGNSQDDRKELPESVTSRPTSQVSTTALQEVEPNTVAVLSSAPIHVSSHQQQRAATSNIAEKARCAVTASSELPRADAHDGENVDHNSSLSAAPKALKHPSPALRTQRQRVRKAIVGSLGGLIGPGGIIVPAASEGLNRLSPSRARQQKRTAVTPEMDTFRTVPATISPVTSTSRSRST